MIAQFDGICKSRCKFRPSREKHSSIMPICKSDHYPISFKVSASVKNKKLLKRKIYNFKKASWDQLNDDLGRVPRSALIDRTDPEIAWSNFNKTVLFMLVDKHIPKITIKNDFSAPWFDAECFEAYRNKNVPTRNSSLIIALQMS